VALTVTDPGTLSNTVTHDVVVPQNAAPTAAFTSSCSTTGCTIDGTTSSDPENQVLSYAWTINDVPAGTTSTISPTLSPGTYTVALTVTDPGTLSNTVTRDVVVQENVAPVAAFTSSCTGLVCTFDASTSTDVNGDIVSRTWNFGDGSPAAEGTVVEHTYAAAADYTVTLVVADSGTLTDDESKVVSVTAPVASNISFVGQSSVSGNVTTHSANVPSGVQTGDALLMFFSGGTTPTTVGTPAGVTGWTALDQLTNASGTTRVWRKVAAAGDAGAQVSITMSALTKGNLMIVAYRGTSAVDPIANFARAAATNTSATRITPTVTVAGSTSWVVSYWMHRDSSSTSLSVPAGVTSRSTGTQTGGGRVTTLLADSDAAVPAGPYGGLAATAQAASSFGTTWTIVLAPE
jgi:PKD repeat protein